MTNIPNNTTLKITFGSIFLTFSGSRKKIKSSKNSRVVHAQDHQSNWNNTLLFPFGVYPGCNLHSWQTLTKHPLKNKILSLPSLMTQDLEKQDFTLCHSDVPFLNLIHTGYLISCRTDFTMTYSNTIYLQSSLRVGVVTPKVTWFFKSSGNSPNPPIDRTGEKLNKSATNSLL